MKKILLFTALLGGVSLAGNATTLKATATAAVKKSTASISLLQPTHVQLLYMMEFSCPKQGWSIPVVGYTRAEMANAYMYYQTHLDC